MYDIIIIGAGPAGLTAGIYAIRSGLKTLIIEKNFVGGQVINTYEIKNFPTYNNISGADFSAKLLEQAMYNNLEIVTAEVTECLLKDKVKVIKTNNKEYKAKTVIIACGAKPRSLNLENEENLTGKGISYCALCDGNFFKNKTVAVIGGGDTCMEDAMYLGGICKKVYIINRSATLRAQQILQNSLFKHKEEKGNIEILYNAEVVNILGSSNLTGIEVFDKNKKETLSLSIDGMFLAIGRIPDTQLFEGQINLNDHGYIVTDKTMKTNLNGVFAAGDCIDKEIRQILTACSDGALAATFANKYIKEG